LAWAAGGAEPAKPEVAEPASVSPALDFAPEWRPLFQGVDLAETHPALGPLAVYTVRIDLGAPGIEFLVTPSNGERELETDGQTVSAFLKEHGLQVAVNASPYSPVNNTPGSPRDISGLSMSCGELYSEPGSELPALLIGRDNRVWFAEPPVDKADAYNGVSGFAIILKDGVNTGTGLPRHPRTAAGLSSDGKQFYLMVIDGRQAGFSIGATTAETADWIRAFGADDAINLDGGGSSALAVAQPEAEAKVINRPIHFNVPGLERVNGNNIGFHALPLPDAP
jgi:hypothetical protein